MAAPRPVRALAVAVAGPLLWLVALSPLRTVAGFEAVPCNVTAVDCGLDFFQEVYEQFQTVQSEVIIMPFFIRPRLKIFSVRRGEAPTLTLLDLVVQAVKRGVHVWILGWDNAASEKFLNYHQDTEFEHIFQASGQDHEHLHLMLDTGRRLMASIYYLPHIKSYVFDRKVAFVGGLDFAENRLDSPQHIRPDPRLVHVQQDLDHMTGNEKPWQDVMAKVDGVTAEHVATVGIERWWTYCKSEGYLRAKAMRPWSAIANSLWKVDHSLSVSEWKNFQCTENPEPASLGILKLSVHGGRGDAGQRDPYAVSVTSPKIQSRNVPGGWTKQVSISSGMDVKVTVRGLRALDREVPSTIDFSVDGAPFVARADREVQMELTGGDQLVARWMPNGLLEEATADSKQMCQVVLSGDGMWMGTESVMRDSYDEHIRIIREAKKFIFIENQYFSTDFPSSSFECQHGHVRSEAVLYSGATNRIGEVLLDRIKRAGRLSEDFSVAVIVPLGTEPGSFYPNLRGTYCFEQAVEDFWKAENLQSDWHDYFSFFFLANAVEAPKHMGGPGSAFYGIFTHTKAIFADDKVALIGSANINDRSMNGDRDAEVGIKIWGGSAVRRFREILMKDHLGDATLADPKRLLASLRSIAEANAKEVKRTMGINFPEGTITRGNRTQQFFGMKGLMNVNPISNAAIEYPDSRVIAGGGGVDTFKWFVVEKAETPRLQGLLFPWSRSIWGLPKVTQIAQIVSKEFSWVELPERQEGVAGEGDDMPPGDWVAPPSSQPLLL
mmetsp:Transcript_58276/g.125175  ORF Transcript_58276/g.125175 Transcript_58276/m.125175 type:complete len:777 (+) Transcript_58276:62-2392(+)